MSSVQSFVVSFRWIVTDYIIFSSSTQDLSAGQRQLLCFARAMLRKTKILVLDEATSSIDLETDEAVQQILRGPDFKHVTTITVRIFFFKKNQSSGMIFNFFFFCQIAHRINTIMDSHRVLVMSEGRVAEYDTPQVLMQRPESLFFSLVQEAGLEKAI